ncbi:MAG: hypothetical protein K1W00_02370 [Lachnospiraceae bacterium]
MGRLKYIFGLLAGVLFIGMYVFGYKLAQSWESEIITFDNKSVAADNQSQVIVKRNTKYTLETYYSDKDETVTENLNIPVELIGLDRNQVIDFIESNTSFFEETDKRILNVMLLSFSDKEVVIRRNVEKAEEATTKYNYSAEVSKYYVVLEENGVVVYKEDKTTVYMETGITENEMDEAMVAELKYGVAIKNISELYRFLESITS